MNVTPPPVPTINKRSLGWFRWFVKGYLRKHFHSLSINRQQLRSVDIMPTDGLVVYANHAAWWDPLIAIHFSHQMFPSFAMYAPIDAQALAKYPMFGRMGFFGIEQQQLSGAREFLSLSAAILAQPSSSIWITPEGRFADVRDTTASLMPGLTHLARRCARGTNADPGATGCGSQKRSQVWFIPLAVEYPFWEERRPELLAWFGRPLSSAAFDSQSKQHVAQELTNGLRQAQQQLATASIARDTSQFEVLGRGHSGTFFVYDWWRQFTGRLKGSRVRLEHGDKLN